MLFNSWAFVGLFLPLVVTIYSLAVRAGWQRIGIAFLTAASLFFYGYWDVWFLPLLLCSILVNYLVVVVMTRHERPNWRRAWFFAGLAFNLGLLFFYKYALFVQSTAEKVGGVSFGLADIVLPLGISFYTFTQLAYLVDAYQRRPIEKNLLNYVLFVTFFPHLIAGPILHHYEMMPQFLRRENSSFSNDLAIGSTIFVFGLAKKVILADSLSLVAKPVFDVAAAGSVPDPISAWTGLLAYTLQIYFDFSGYTDMAIGASKMLGIRLPVNFASPYRAISIIDFWRRWHITLSRFLRDYLYIPLGGNRVKPAKLYANIFITMLLGGIWHGAGWTYMLWGAMHGAMIVINHFWQRAWRGPPVPRWAGWAITFLAVMLAWVPFRSPDLETTGRMYAALIGMGGLPEGFGTAAAYEFLRNAVIHAVGLGSGANINPLAAVFVLPVALFIALAMPNVQYIIGPTFPGLPSPGYPDFSMPPLIRQLDMRWRPNTLWSIVVGILAAISLLKLNDVTEFIYFQF